MDILPITASKKEPRYYYLSSFHVQFYFTTIVIDDDAVAPLESDTITISVFEPAGPEFHLYILDTCDEVRTAAAPVLLFRITNVYL